MYVLCYPSEEFLLVAGAFTGKSLGLFCSKEDDAQAQLRKVFTVDPRMRGGSKVFQLKVNGMAFRLIPEQSQVKNNLRVREKSGSAANSFPGVPVF
ncbi:Protein TIC 22-like [Arachis hypogaea]|nr:Protein TIC 22-like [Arachis hypogaea]